MPWRSTTRPRVLRRGVCGEASETTIAKAAPKVVPKKNDKKNNKK